MGDYAVTEIIDPVGDAKTLARAGRVRASPATSPRVKDRLDAAGSTTEVGRVLDQADDLFPVSWLRIALRVARSVGRIEGPNPGTGTLVSPRLLLTNHHVLPNEKVAARHVLVLNDELDPGGRPMPVARYSLRPDRFFLSDAKLDFSLVAVPPVAARRFGFQRLIAELGKAREGDHVAIIQHPGGGPKEIAFRQNRVTAIGEDTIQYQTDTLDGSSGSPVFNDQWELVALHHASVPRTDGDGEWLGVDGRPSGLDRTKVHWVANEGIRVSRILAAVAAADIDPSRKAFVDEVCRPS